MTSPIPHQLRRLDEALLALLDERRRMLDELAPEARSGSERASIDDLLRRHDGPFAADDVRAVFHAVEAGCARRDARHGEVSS